MTNLVPAEQAVTIVGVERGRWLHYGRNVTAREALYILHSEECRLRHPDLRKCPFSVALDRGLDDTTWADYQDQALPLAVTDERLVPLASLPNDTSLRELLLARNGGVPWW